MTDPEHNAYRAALEPWVKRAAREHKVVAHVRWTADHAEVMMIPRAHAMSAVSVAQEPLFRVD